MKYLVVYEKGPTSHGAFVPDPPGCAVAGESPAEVKRDIRIALHWHLEAMREDNESIPASAAWAEEVDVQEAVR